MKYSEIKAHIEDLLYLSLPTCLFFIFLFIQGIINIAFITNKYNDFRMIGALGLTDLYINCTTHMFLIGIVGGVEIIGSNYYGNKNYYNLGLTVIRAKLISLSYYLLITTFNFFYALKIIAFFFKVEENVIDLMRPYLFFSILNMGVKISFIVDFRYISIAGKSYINSIILFSATLIHPLFNYIFINLLDLKLFGVGLSTLIVQIISTCGLIAYIRIYDPIPGSYISLNKECFEEWGKYLKICLPSTLQLVGEWMGFEIQAFIVMQFSSLHYSVHIVFINIQMIIFTFALSVNIAMSINIAIKIITFSKKKLLEFIKVSYIVSKIGIITIILCVHIFRYPILRNLTSDGEMREIAIENLGVLYLYFFLDNGYFFLGSIMKGMAYLVIPATITMINYYVVQTCLSYIFCIVLQYGVRGIWIGLCFGDLFGYVSFFILLYNLDINHMKELALLRVGSEKDHDVSTRIGSFLIDNNVKEMQDLSYIANDKLKFKKIYNDEI